MAMQAGVRGAVTRLVASLAIAVALAACAHEAAAPAPTIDPVGPDPDPGTDPVVVSIDDLEADVVRGSLVRLTWRASNAASIDAYAVSDAAAGAPIAVAEGMPGTTTSLTVPIPEGHRQTLRVVARAGPAPSADDRWAEAVPDGVVTNESDYDVRFGDEPVPGSLRYVLANADDGAVIGFAADVRTVDLVGIDEADGQRAHLRLGGGTTARRVTISGPAWHGAVGPLVTLRSAPDLDFVRRSGVLVVAPDADVAIDDVGIAGGAFTERGGGVRNDGVLVLTGVVVEGNRAWAWGGGIHNQEGTLTLRDVIVRDNVSAVLDDEPGGTPVTIDGEGGFTTFCAPTSANACDTVTIANGGAGGGVQNIGGVVTIVDSVVLRNHAKFSGGGLCNVEGSVVIVDSDFIDNLASSAPYPTFDFPNRGGGVYSTRSGAVTISGGRFEGNVVDEHDGWGGGVSLRYSATLVMDDVIVVGNRASLGGGVFTETAIGAPVNYALGGITYAGNVATVEGADRFHWDIEP
jgi:hypothetical protein